jgi:catechol 2,3-dioxygenase-like lactoylglutathione lyase family enzyme
MLQHVTLEVRADQVEDCISFWGLLGFERTARPPLLPDNSAWVERQGTQVHIIWVDAPMVPRVGHAAVLVDDYAAALAGLERAGFQAEPGLDAWGPRSFVHDPAGHLVEVMSAPPLPPWPQGAQGAERPPASGGA